MAFDRPIGGVSWTGSHFPGSFLPTLRTSEAYCVSLNIFSLQQRENFQVQGVRVTFHLFQKAITSSKIDLEQKFLLVSAIHGLPFHLR